MYRHDDLFSRWFSLHRWADRTGDKEISPEGRCENNHRQFTESQSPSRQRLRQNNQKQYNFLDLVPKGREENGPSFGLMDWVRHHDRYDDTGLVEPTGQNELSKDTESCCQTSVG